MPCLKTPSARHCVMRASVVRPCGVFLTRAIGPGVPRAVAETFRGMSVWMLDNVFPEFDWRGFGEHMGQNELSEDADLVSLVHFGVFSGQALGSPNMGSGSSGLSGPSRNVLGSFGFCVYTCLETSSIIHCYSITAGSSIGLCVPRVGLENVRGTRRRASYPTR